MPNFYIGPWTWDSTVDGYVLPTGAVGGIDLRPLSAHVPNQQNHARNFGVFVTAGNGTLSSPYFLMGSDPAGNVNSTRRNGWMSRMQMASLTATRLADIVAETLGDKSDPVQVSSCGTVMPDGPDVQIWLPGVAGRLWGRTFQGKADQFWPKIQERERIAYRKIRNWSLLGSLLDLIGLKRRETHRRWLGERMLKWSAYGVAPRDFIPTDLPEEEPIAPTTTIADTFDRGNSNTTLGSDWTAGNNTVWGIDSSSAYMVSATTSQQDAVHNTALSSGDHYSQASVTGTTTTEGAFGPILRRDATLATKTWYGAGPRRANAWWLYKLVAGTLTNPLSVSVTNVSTTVYVSRLNVAGTTYSMFRDGTQLGSNQTDVSFPTGNLHCGIGSHGQPASARYVDFEASDGLGGGVVYDRRLSSMFLGV